MWNRRTGNLVGGHQRLAIIDDLEGTQDYLLDVAVVDVDDRAERELNIFLNNPSAQGSYDLAQLESLLADVDIHNTGFDAAELQMLLPDLNTDAIFSDGNDKAAKESVSLQELRESRHKYKDESRKANDPEFYLLLVFQNRAECEEFAKAAKMPTDTRYLDGRCLAENVGIELTTAEKIA